MKILYLDCPMGAAGDMLTAALWELIDDKENTLKEIRGFILPQVSVSFESKITSSVVGTHTVITINGEEEGKHTHHHIHRTFSDVRKIICSMNLEDTVRDSIVDVYTLIADAEAKAHNTDNAAVHFHEVGMYDAIADVTIFCCLLDKLDVDRVIVSPINTGKGTVSCAHGILPVPAPATSNLLFGVPCYCNDVVGELCTPTGAALIRKFADEFTDMPKMTVNKIGTGVGTKEFDRPNAVRAFLGFSDDSDNVAELSCNIDDMTGEELAFAVERLMSLGALDVTLTPIIMKKGRPAFELRLLCKPTDRDMFARHIFKNTTTIGIRVQGSFRYTLDRECKYYAIGDDTYSEKHSFGFGTEKRKLEYDDIKKYADRENISFFEARKILENNAKQQ